MAIGKFIGGYVFHSQALIADACHALTDLVSDFMTLGTVSLASKTPTSRFPNGFGKIESLGALGVSGLLLGGGVLMGMGAVHALMMQAFPDLAHALEHWGLLGHAHGHSHSHVGDLSGAVGPNINAAWLAGGSILIKESLYRATMKVARERKSSVLASNAIHHRIDSLTSIVALLTIGGAHVLPSALWLDPVGGLLISMMVINAGYANTKTSLLELADSAVDPEMTSVVRKATVEALQELPISTFTSGITSRSNSSSSSPSSPSQTAQEEAWKQIRVARVSGIKAGQNYLMGLDLVVPADWTMAQTHSIEQHVRETVGGKVRGLKRLKVRFVPDTAVPIDSEAREEDVERQLGMEEFVEPKEKLEADEKEEGEVKSNTGTEDVSSSVQRRK
ncbi:hypothetical protein KEM56_007366 [Ascosphaera pollenicola]|nr:hypothetical protein KEM56_007366 [Ascosphaera pollenicola]